MKTDHENLQSDAPLTWVGEYPVVRNKTVAISILVVWTIACCVVGLFLVGLAVHNGNFELVRTLLSVVGGVWLALIILSFLIAQLFFGGKVVMEVVIDRSGVTQIQRSNRAKWANRAAMLGGALVGGARGATTAGAGMLAASRDAEGWAWSDLCEAKGSPDTGEIRLWDEWHTVMQVFAPREQYDEAMGRIEAGIAKASAHRKPPDDIPVAAKVLVCLGAVICGAFLLPKFPLAFSPVFAIPLVILTFVTILTRPPMRQWLGWGLATAVVVSVVAIFQTSPPSLHEPGSGLVLAIQLAVIGLFALFGLCAGLGVFNLNPPSLRS